MIFTFFYPGKSNQSYEFHLKWDCCEHCSLAVRTKCVRPFFFSKIILDYSFFYLIINNLFELGVYHQRESNLKLHVYSTYSLILFYD